MKIGSESYRKHKYYIVAINVIFGCTLQHNACFMAHALFKKTAFIIS